MKKAVKISIVLWLSIGMLVSCSKDDDVINDPTNQGGDDPGGGGTNDQPDPPITLDCNYFYESRTLTKNPKAKVDYIITCVMKIRGDITIEPGVVIEFEQNAGISLDDFNNNVASISAKGTSVKPIVFRGVKKEDGYWKGFFIDSNDPYNELDYVHIEDAGGAAFNSNGDKGAIVLYAGGRLKLSNSVISNSKTLGLNANYGGATLEIQNNKFKNNNAPVKIRPEYINAINNSNDYSGNTEDFVFITNSDLKNIPVTTWKKINVPYHVKGFRIANAYLTVEPGVVAEFDVGAEIYIWNYTDPAGFKAVGTAADPIIFTAINKVPGGWNGIRFFYSKHILNEIAFVEFHYSGGSTSQGSVHLGNPCVLNIHDVTFKNIRNCAIKYDYLEGLTINNITLDPGACLKAKN